MARRTLEQRGERMVLGTGLVLVGVVLAAMAAAGGWAAWWLDGERWERTAEDLFIGMALAAVLGLGGLWVAYRRLRARIAGLTGMAEAVGAWSQGERGVDALRVDDARAGEPGRAWNEWVERMDALERGVATTGDLPREGVEDRDAVMDSLWHGVLVLGPDGIVRRANPAAMVMLGKPTDGYKGLGLGELLGDASAGTAAARACAGTRTRQSFEVRRAPDGGKRAGLCLRVGVRGLKDGGAVAVLEDVTQQREADAARDTFVTQAAHELRTPLTTIRLYVESLLEGVQGAEREEAVNAISRESTRLERIVSDMLSVAEIEAGSMGLRVDDVRLEGVVEALRQDFATQAKEKGLELVFDLPPKIPVIRGDRDRLTLALHNLVGNAVKYTPTGGVVRVRLREEEGPGGCVAVDVEDTGIGIKEEEQELVFERFYRTRDARVGDVTGTGLGLTLARQVARLHKGDIRLRSEVNKGSIFTLTVPKAA